MEHVQAAHVQHVTCHLCQCLRSQKGSGPGSGAYTTNACSECVADASREPCCKAGWVACFLIKFLS